MADINQLKSDLAKIEAQIVDLRKPILAADVALAEAQKSLDSFLNSPQNLRFSDLMEAKKAAAASPENAQLRQKYAEVQNTWDQQQSVYLPLLRARDAAADTLTALRRPLVEAESQAAEIEIDIAKIDPAQASPAAVNFLRQNGELPITAESDPTVAEVTTSVVIAPNVIEPIIDPNTDPGVVNEIDGTIDPAAINALDPPAITDHSVDPGVINDLDATPAVTPSTTSNVPANSTTGLTAQTRKQATAQTQTNFQSLKDWRVILRLASGSNYLYNATPPGILEPLKKTDGVVFPYTPQVSVQYTANYDPTEITHSNYKIFQYKSSAVDAISISCDFTAQDTNEARYLLAVIHFFRSATKMFYGKDLNPKNGTPPPLCYLYGLGEFQFNNHPLAITGFTYSLPTDVDYIKVATSSGTGTNSSVTNFQGGTSVTRPAAAGLAPGGTKPEPSWSTSNSRNNSAGVTYVPTKMQIQISAVPIVSRNDISTRFSLRDYATGKLLQGSSNGTSNGGIW